MEALTLGAHRLVHLDLKGAPPKVTYFEKLFPVLKEWGATGILLEWEDTFPYSRELSLLGGLSQSALATGAPYSLEEGRAILSIAEDCNLIVVPLIQTFGHMEFVLKHEQWRGLREVPDFPSSLCPSNSEVHPLIRAMLRQVITLHGELQYIHIGCDEVWHMGICQACQKRIQVSRYGKTDLFLEHVTQVAQFIKESYPRLKIIVWDDMIRSAPLIALQDLNIGSLVEPMIWLYAPAGPNFQLGGDLWDRYSAVFKHIWAASAFKGATGSCQILPHNKYHVSNHEAWLTEISTHGSRLPSFRGLALTGWSRYDHYATLCELLPAALPCLALCLKTWLNGNYSSAVLSTVSKMLGYEEPPLMLEPPPRPFILSQTMLFPGHLIALGIEWLMNVKAKYNGVAHSEQIQTWLNPWQIQNNYTNPMQIESLMPVLTDLLVEVTALESFVRSNFEQFYFSPTIDEFIGTLIVPMKIKLQQLRGDCEQQLSLGCRVRGMRSII